LNAVGACVLGPGGRRSLLRGSSAFARYKLLVSVEGF
jgi:hypothetical protein